MFQGLTKLVAAQSGALLLVGQGAHEQTIDAEGNRIACTFNPRARLWLELGDRAVLAAANLDDDRIAAVEVIAIGESGLPTVQLLACELPAGAVYAMRAPMPRPEGKLRALVRRARLDAMGGAP
jgi:hypothetical protein